MHGKLTGTDAFVRQLPQIGFPHMHCAISME
jgi:hypothetical protein